MDAQDLVSKTEFCQKNFPVIYFFDYQKSKKPHFVILPKSLWDIIHTYVDSILINTFCSNIPNYKIRISK